MYVQVLEFPKFSPTVVCKADLLPGTPIPRIWTTKRRYETESAIDSDVVLDPGSKTPCLDSSDQANVGDD